MKEKVDIKMLCQLTKVLQPDSSPPSHTPRAEQQHYATAVLINRRLIKSAVKVFRFNHIDNDMGILLPHEMHNVVHLIGGHHGVKQIHFLVTVTSHRVHTGYAVSVLFDVLVYDFRRLGGGNLQCNPFIPVMEGRDGFGGYELEQDGISCVQPWK